MRLTVALILKVLCLILEAVNLTHAVIYADVAHSFNVNCGPDSPCTQTLAECLPLEGDSGYTCACNTEHGFFLENGKCVLQSRLDQLCDGENSRCVDAYSECRDDGSGSATTRCVCQMGTTKVQLNDNTEACAKSLAQFIDPDCSECESFGGTCYDVDGDDMRDGCHCPASLSGDNCQTTHLFVTCDMDTMTICYLPHSGVNMADGGRLYADGKSASHQCVAVPGDAQCGPGMYILKLPLAEQQRETCGTKKFPFNNNAVKFENMMAVSATGEGHVTGDVRLMKTYCVYRTQVDTSFSGLHAQGSTGDDIGKNYFPSLFLELENILGTPIKSGTKLRIGDLVKFKLYLDTTSGYSSVSVENCMLSTSPVFPDDTASVLSVTQNGCPAPDQTMFTTDTTWFRRSPTRLMTGPIPLRPLRLGEDLFLHCQTRVCVPGSDDQCSDAVCGSTERKKREAEENVRNVEIHQKIEFEENEEHADVNNLGTTAGNSSYLMIEKTTFAAVLVVLVVVVSGAVIAAIMIKKHCGLHKHQRSTTELIHSLRKDTLSVSVRRNQQVYSIHKVNSNPQSRI